MKKLLIILLALGLTQAGFAQSKTVDYYIHLTVETSTQGFQTGQTVLEMPALKSPLDSLVQQTQFKTVLKKGNILDALNYFSQQGWQLVSTTNIPYGSQVGDKSQVYYLLRKQVAVP